MPRQVPPTPTDEELNTYILTRYALLGIDIFVLPEADENAPMDRERLLANGRSILRQDAAAGSIGVSENFLGKVERSSDSVQWGKLFQVIQELGLSLSVEVPEPFAEQIQARLKAAQSKGAGFSSPADGGCRR